jgi:predicted ester cyclase
VSAEENKAVVRRLIEEVYNRGNLDVVDELVAPDVLDHAAVPQHRHGIDAFKHVIGWVRGMSSDIHYDVDDLFAEGEKVAVRTTVSGTDTGPIRDVPPPAKGSRWTTSIGSVLRRGRSRSCGP